MVLSNIQVLLEVKYDTVIKRWLSSAIVPLGENPSTFNISGEAVIANYETKTRSTKYAISTSGDVIGKVCIFGSFDTRSADMAVEYASDYGAQALLVRHEPDIGVTIPTMLMSEEQFKYIEDYPRATISAVYISGSYTSIDATLRIQKMSNEMSTELSNQSLQLKRKMFVPSTMLDNTISSLHFSTIIQARPYRANKIISDLGEDVSGKICSFETNYSGDAARAIQLATEHGARALILCCKDSPDLSNLTIPVLTVGKDDLEELKRTGLLSKDLGVTISYGEVDTVIEQRKDPPSSAPLDRHQSQESQQRDPPESESWLARGVNWTKKAILGYSPKSKKEFEATISKGTSWSYDDPGSSSFREAMLILDRIKKADSFDDQEEELKVLVQAVHEMTQKVEFVGDVLVLLFCAHILSVKDNTRIRLPTFQLLNAMTVIMNHIIIDPKVSPPKSCSDRQVLNRGMIQLVQHIANQQSRISNHTTFVVNALWIRVYICDKLRDGIWKDLGRVTSLKYIESNKETILQFMEPHKFNTVVLTSIPLDLIDIINFFKDSDVPILPTALQKLKELYERNKWTREMWKSKFVDTRELTMLNLIERLSVRGKEEIAKKVIIRSVIERAGFESTNSFQELAIIYSSLKASHKNYDMVCNVIEESICTSLESRLRSCPTPEDVSSILQSSLCYFLVNEKCWGSLMKFTKASHNKESNFELFGHIYLFICQMEHEDQMACVNELINTICHCIKSTKTSKDAYAVAAFQVASKWRDIFSSPEEQTIPICSHLGKLIISETGIASTLRREPSMLYDIPSFQIDNDGNSLINILVCELVQDLNAQCSKIEDAVSLYSGISSVHAQESSLGEVASDIILKSFTSWNPSSLCALLEVDGSILLQAYKLLGSLSHGDEEKGIECANKIKSIVLRWKSSYNNGDLDHVQLGNISSALAVEKRKALESIAEGDFPTKAEIKKKILSIKNIIEEIRSLLTIHSQKDGASISHSILDLATAYRINANDGSLLSELISTYFCGTNPIISLASLNTSKGTVRLFLKEHERELKAAAHFLSNKSVLFERQVGTWTDIRYSDFHAKISSVLEHFGHLFSSSVTFSVIVMAAKVIAEENVCAENELRVISSFQPLGIDDNDWLLCIFRSIALAHVLSPLEKFIDCCKTHRFMFVTSDGNFTELANICERLLSEEAGLDLDVNECNNIGQRIADILVPHSKSLNLEDRFEGCVPTLHFFDALRHCSSVFSMARERMWFGEEGLLTFYKEWTNVSNVFQSGNLFENELLDRLEPTIRIISAVGGELNCSSVESLVLTLQNNRDIDKLDEMRLVQANICKVQDWFAEGLDDTAAILGKFALIQVSGSFILTSEYSTESMIPNRSLVLQYSRSQSSEDETVTMTQDEIKDFVQYLGFMNHNDDSSTNHTSNFIDLYRQLSEMIEIQQEVVNVGYCDVLCTANMECPIYESGTQYKVEESLNESQKLFAHCHRWLKDVRSKFRYSLLFWLDELRYIYQGMSKLRSNGSDMDELELQADMMNAVSRLSPSVSQNLECLSLMIEYINEEAPRDISWLEDVSKLVNICGVYSEELQLQSFKAIEPSCHKKLVIHKIHCYEDMVYSTPLHVLQHIYKTRSPASFEVLDAAVIQTPDEIHLFLERVCQFPNQTFTIIAVDKLSANEQEIIAKFLANHSRSADEMHLHCIQLRDTILHAPPGVEILLWDKSTLLNDMQHESWLQKNVTERNHINNITIVGGSAGSGKTGFIRREMKRLVSSGYHVASLYIHEDFSLASAVTTLRAKFNNVKSRNRALHIGFSMTTNQEGNEITTSRNDLLISINNFFYSFLVLQSVYDSSSGSCFHSGTHLYDLFVELDCGEDGLRWLGSNVPILTCCDNIIQPPSDFIIDEQTRRVCTYLRALDDGTIDRKFNPASVNKRIFFVLDKSGSMEIELGGGRNALEVAADSMLAIYDSHVQLMDYVGLIRFNHTFEELLPLHQVQDENQRHRLRNTIYAARNNPYGSTEMYKALRHVIDSLSRCSDSGGDAYIICLTDGQSFDNEHVKADLERQLRDSPHNLHVILIGVNLDPILNIEMENLCNKYQHGNHRNKGFFLPTSMDMTAIERAFREVAARIPVSETFELDGIMSDEECRAKLEEHRPEFISPSNKLLYSFWVKFLHRRVSVFDSNNDFNYNEEHDALGSSLMRVMLSESMQMLRREQNISWTSSNHTQLIYDFTEKDSPRFRLICTAPEKLDEDQRESLTHLDLPGFKIPTTSELRDRSTLDRFLSQALSIPLVVGPDDRKSLQCIDDNRFVLTLDFTLKLLNVHERVSCGVPCIMEGETGVSKTALTNMYSILVNSQQSSIAALSTLKALDMILHEMTQRYPTVVLDGDLVVKDQIIKFLEPSTQYSTEEASLVISDLIYEACQSRSPLFEPIPSHLATMVEAESTQELVNWFADSKLVTTFFDINIHGSLTADDLKKKVDEARHVAQNLSGMDVKVVIFLDEINTSSVLGLLKELVVDRSFNGDLLEANIVVIAACNPVRQSVVSHHAKPSRDKDLGRNWVGGHYQVKKLPLSLEMMTWDFGSLNSEQEKEFIYHRIKMMNEQIGEVVARGMTEVVSNSHELIRELAEEHILPSLQQHSCENNVTEAKLRARSVVSLRDIQRVFHLFGFFLHEFSLGSQLLGETPDRLRRAMLLAVGIVYYLRLDSCARATFLEKLNSLPSEQTQHCHLKEVLESSIDTLMKHTEIPTGIALTRGVKENVFMTMICTLSRTPLMIVGPPGCSKTLAVSIADDNANGEESPSLFYRNFARIQPFHYQCSKTSTSTEVASVFDRAIQRQSKVSNSKQQCLVFMDEAGLPEEEKESLKVLHYLLEGHMSASPDISFVCITNHVLDAAKSNRCVCLLRPEPDNDELMCIATGILCQKHKHDDSNIDLVSFEEKTMTVDEFSAIICECYLELQRNKEGFQWFVQFFGLRDFIHLLIFVRRSALLRASVLYVSPEILLHAIERNFNGVVSEEFSNICGAFLAKFIKDRNRIEESLNRFLRHPMNVLKDSLSEILPEDSSRYTLARYKMIIDSTNDDSVMRLLQMSGILNESHSFYKLSGLDEGAELEQLNLVSRVKFAAQQGKKTAVMSQVEQVSECFYDLFNQHFKEFKKANGETSYFANIAIGGISRPCLIHPSFQCIVHVQSNQLDDIPAPFLNRFEKFQLSVGELLSFQLSRLPGEIAGILSSVLRECEGFLVDVGDGSIWSSSPGDTLKSIFISMIPPDFDSHPSVFNTITSEVSISQHVLRLLKGHLSVDISIKDIEQAIAASLSELRGSEGMELRRVLDMDGGVDEILLTNEVSDSSPLLRSVKSIAHYALLRYAMLKLLQVARPEAIFLQRDCLPRDAIEAFFGGSQDHFNLKSLVSNLGRNTSQLFVINVHSDSCAHSLPTWCGGGDRDDIDGNVFKTVVEEIVHDNPSNVQIQHIDLLKSESSLRNTIESWASAEEVDYFVLVVDMQLQCSTNLVNFTRSSIEQLRLAPTKKFLLLLHYPLSKMPSYPSLFLGKWQCIYLDGIGYRGFASSPLSINSIIMTGLDEAVLDADMLLDALLPKAIQYVASQVPFYSRGNSQSVNRQMQFTERLRKIEDVMNRQIKEKSLGYILCTSYLDMWTKDAIREMLGRSAHGLKSGTTHLSLSSAIRSTFQHTFNKFVANAIIDINVWMNLDVLVDASSTLETDSIFLLILKAMPRIPLKELQLHRDVHHHLTPLPLELSVTKPLVLFPFYYQLSSFIDMVLDKTNIGANVTPGSRVDHVESFDLMLSSLLESPLTSSLSIDKPMIEAMQRAIEHVESSSELFVKYVMNHLSWRFGVGNSSQVIRWILNKMPSSMSTCHQSIIFLHLVCRLHTTHIIRMASWDLPSNSFEFATDDGEVEGVEFVNNMVGHFTSLLSNDTLETKGWNQSFSNFLLSIEKIVGDDCIVDRTVIRDLRQLVFVNVLFSVCAPEAATLQIRQHTGHSLNDVFELLDNFITGGKNEFWIQDAKDKLLRIFFSPWWLKTLDDIDNADANFLIESIKTQNFEHQAAVVHLRNLLLYGPGSNQERNNILLPTRCFSHTVAMLVCKTLSCQSSMDFCEESGQRTAMPHYIPPWLCSEILVVNNDPDDEISWYFQGYENSFECPLADVMFDIILGFLVDRISHSCFPSEQLLLLFQQSVARERAVTRKDYTKNARLQALQQHSNQKVPLVGSHLSAIEASALLVCLVCKIADELSASSEASALQGIGSHSAHRLMDIIMTTHTSWSQLFFSVILRKCGEGHMAHLISDGALSRFGWCSQWKKGISSLNNDILAELRDATRLFQEAERDITRFSQQYRACPHCRGLFQVDQRNCGQFYCGRDAHGVGGHPAIGGAATRDTYGCGRGFTLGQELSYEQSNQYPEDQAALRRLRDDLTNKQRVFDEFNESAELWKRAEQFEAECMSFAVHQNLQVEFLLPSANLVDYMPENEGNPGTGLLVRVISQLPMIEHVSYLPDMIELYMFLHKNFRHLLTKDQAMNIKMNSLMTEDLLSNRFGHINSAHLQRVWLRVVEGVNKFLMASDSKVMFDCTEVHVPDIESLTLISFLSEMESPTEGHDYLFLIINGIILQYNNFVKSISVEPDNQTTEEIQPRTLVRASKDSIMVNGISPITQSLIENLVESYWIKDEHAFNIASLSRAISHDIQAYIGQMRMIKTPLSYLREKFNFREESSFQRNGNVEPASDCFRSFDMLYFARAEDLALYEEVLQSAKKLGCGGETNLRHTILVTLHTFGYNDWTNLLEELLAALCQLQDSRGTTINLCNVSCDDSAQTNLLRSITNDDVMEVIQVCGEQLSSEAFRFVSVPSRLAEPMDNVTKGAIQEGIMRLLKSKTSGDVINEIAAFSTDVLNFYSEKLIVPASESSSEGLSEFLKKNNCCLEESDNIFAAIPQEVSIRNLIDLQKTLYQIKLKLLFDSKEIVPSSATHYSAHQSGQYSRWKWVARARSQEEKVEEVNRYTWKPFSNLWFEDALSKTKQIESQEINAESDAEEKKEDTEVGLNTEKTVAVSPMVTEAVALVEEDGEDEFVDALEVEEESLPAEKRLYDGERKDNKEEEYIVPLPLKAEACGTRNMAISFSTVLVVAMIFMAFVVGFLSIKGSNVHVHEEMSEEDLLVVKNFDQALGSDGDEL